MGLFGSDKNLAAQLAELTASNAELLEKLSTSGKHAEELSAHVERLTAELDAEKKASLAKDALPAAKDAEIAELKAKLANPPAAYADASEGKDEAVAEGGEAQRGYWEQYYSISDPAERTRFWRKNREALENEQRHTAK